MREEDIVSTTAARTLGSWISFFGVLGSTRVAGCKHQLPGCVHIVAAPEPYINLVSLSWKTRPRFVVGPNSNKLVALYALDSGWA